MGSEMYLTVSYCILLYAAFIAKRCIFCNEMPQSKILVKTNSTIVCDPFLSKINLTIRPDNAAVIALFRIYLFPGSYFMGRSAGREGFAAQAI